VINFNVNYQTDYKPETEICRAEILNVVKKAFKDMSFDLTYSNFINIKKISIFDMIERFGLISKVVKSTSNTSFIIIDFNYYMNIEVRERLHDIILHYNIYANTAEDIQFGSNKLKSVFSLSDKDDNDVNIRWYYHIENSSDFMSVDETIGDIIYPEAYPYIENFDNYVDNYVDGNEPVLILTGPSGSGKTRLIRHIVSRINKKVIGVKSELVGLKMEHFYNEDDHHKNVFFYTNDMRVLENGTIFIDYLVNKIAGMVLEDIDMAISKRSEGNDIISKLLSAADGFVTASNKKILVSSNLTTINQIDDAFKRPGRCYDIIVTRLLKPAESVKLLDILYPGNKYNVNHDMSLAEIYNLASYGINSNRKGRIGF